MNEAELIEIERRANAATPGPWQHHGRRSAGGTSAHVTTEKMVSGYYKDKTRNGEVCRVLDNEGRHDCQINADVEFIAASRTDVPRLLAEVRHLRGALAADAHRLEAAAMRVGIIAGCDAPDEMADLIELLRASRTWQPIETAPKDGTKIIVLCPLRGCRIASWRADEFSNPPRPYWTTWSSWTTHDRSDQPTHWMPLPEPPSKLR